MVVPVRPEFTKAVAYYMETGDIWLGEDTIADDPNSFYFSLLNDLEDVKETVVGNPWTTRVPSTLTIIQDGAAIIADKGLPCCDEVHKGYTVLVDSHDATLKLLEPK